MFIRFLKFSVVPVAAFFDLINILNIQYLTNNLSVCKF